MVPPVKLVFFLQHPGVNICMVAILFATRGSTPLKKMIMMKKLSRKSFIETATCTAAKGREESFKSWGKRSIHGIFFVIKLIAAPSACSFLPGAVSLAKPSQVTYFFYSLQWVEKVTAQMIPSFSPLWHGSLFVTSTVCMYEHTP